MRPDVTCVVAAYRSRLVWEAVADALAQVGPSVEVLVLDDCADREPLLPVDGRVRHHRLDFCSLNHKKRLAAELALGEFMAVFDDDDRSAPWRLAVQLDQMRREKTAGHCFRGQMFYHDGAAGRLWLREGSATHNYDASMVLRTDVARGFPVPDDLWATGHWLIDQVAKKHGRRGWSFSAGLGVMALGLNPENRSRYILDPPGWRLVCP
jgi:hypothetical protein